MKKISVILLFGILMMDLCIGYTNCPDLCEFTYSSSGSCNSGKGCLENGITLCICVWDDDYKWCDVASSTDCTTQPDCVGTTVNYNKRCGGSPAACQASQYFCVLMNECTPYSTCGCTYKCDETCNPDRYVSCTGKIQTSGGQSECVGNINTCERNCGSNPDCDERVNGACISGGRYCLTTDCEPHELDSSSFDQCKACSGSWISYSERFTTGTNANCCEDDSGEHYDASVGIDGKDQCCSNAIWAIPIKAPVNGGTSGAGNCPEFSDYATVFVILGILGTGFAVRKKLR